MKRITIHVKNDRDAELLKSVIEKTDFEDTVEAFEEDDEITEEELRILEERWEHYKKNPSSGTSLQDFKKEMKKKYGV